ncbi:MAG: GTPase Era, partial [Myxococcales bacterium]|nr:GTPase Era [Myxococcales bacterium]
RGLRTDRAGDWGRALSCGLRRHRGRPNVGKSTLLNRLLGQKLAATTHKPQTTRQNLLGVLNPQDAQIGFLDTPGHHRAKGPLNRFMVAQAEEALERADLVAYVVEARPHGAITPGNVRIIAALRRVQKPVVLLVNKTDLVKEKEKLLLQLKAYSDELGELLRAVVPISARKSAGLERAVQEIGRALPEGERFFDTEMVTDATERSISSEMIREKLILELQDELPYAAAVTVESFEDQRPRLVRIGATIHVERQSQKGIVVGKAGERLRSIGIRARHDLEYFLGSKVYLDLVVRVNRDWTSNPARLQNLGYGRDEDQDLSIGRDLLEALAVEEDDNDDD